MPIPKDQLKRLCLIDSAIRCLHQPSKEMIRLHVCEGLSLPHDGICHSSIEKDLFMMKMDFDAPIKYNHTNGYHYNEQYSFFRAFMRYWSAYLVLPPEIDKMIYDDSVSLISDLPDYDISHYTRVSDPGYEIMIMNPLDVFSGEP